MSLQTRSFGRQVREHNLRLDAALRKRVGICLETYKIIKNLTQLAGVAVGFYAISQGADPMTVFALITVIITGPEAIEYVLTNGTD